MKLWFNGKKYFWITVLCVKACSLLFGQVTKVFNLLYSVILQSQIWSSFFRSSELASIFPLLPSSVLFQSLNKKQNCPCRIILLSLYVKFSQFFFLKLFFSQLHFQFLCISYSNSASVTLFLLYFYFSPLLTMPFMSSSFFFCHFLPTPYSGSI